MAISQLAVVVNNDGRQGHPSKGSTSGSGGDTYDPMEARVKHLEEDMREVRTDVRAMRLDVSEIKGKLSSMPTTWQMIGIFATMIGFLLAGGTFVIAASRYFGI